MGRLQHYTTAYEYTQFNRSCYIRFLAVIFVSRNSSFIFYFMLWLRTTSSHFGIVVLGFGM